MMKLVNLGAATAVFAGFSALGYVIMAGGFPGAAWTGFTERIKAFSAPAVVLIGPGVTGAAIIITGSILAGYILFGRTGVEDEQT
jgi:hypothetical protein